MNTQATIDYIVDWLKNYNSNAGTTGFVIGVSGGIDSAVSSTLAAKTELPLLCLKMPIHQNQGQMSRASGHIKYLRENYANVASLELDLTKVFDSFVKQVPANDNQEAQELSLANTRARFRMSTLYYFAALEKKLVLGTGNKIEDFGVGFYTKYGDGGVDLSPIADLVKTEVYELGQGLGIMNEIIQAPPTDGLWEDNRSDEDQLGASYSELEWAMKFTENNRMEQALSAREKQVLDIYRRFNRANKHKMLPIPVCEIPEAVRNG